MRRFFCIFAVLMMAVFVLGFAGCEENKPDPYETYPDAYGEYVFGWFNAYYRGATFDIGGADIMAILNNTLDPEREKHYLFAKEILDYVGKEIIFNPHSVQFTGTRDEILSYVSLGGGPGYKFTFRLNQSDSTNFSNGLRKQWTFHYWSPEISFNRPHIISFGADTDTGFYSLNHFAVAFQFYRDSITY